MSTENPGEGLASPDAENVQAAVEANPATSAATRTSSAAGSVTESLAVDDDVPATMAVRGSKETPTHAEGRVQRSARPGANIALGRGAPVGRYVILEVLAEGGMGVVYKAYDPDLDRKVALKCVRPTRNANEHVSRGRERLFREAQALAQLSHPNVVAVYDVGTVNDEVFIAMELIEGKTLKEWLRESTRSPEEILRVFLEAGAGLAAAHRAGLVHRDFKPDNVVLGADGRVRVLDFGLARAGAAADEANPTAASSSGEHDLESSSTSHSGRLWSTSLTQVGAVVGTPPYMAPEQFEGAEVNAFSDQFSYCVSLWEALYGRRPFAARTFDALRHAVLSGRIDEPQTNSRVTTRLRRILERGLAVQPHARYSSMDALLVELRHDPRVARRRALLIGAAVLLMASSAFGFYRLSGRQEASCRGMGARLAGVWDDAMKKRVLASFRASGRPYADDTFQRVGGLLDAYASGWALMRQESCEATRVRGEQSETLMDLRMLCLDRRLTEVGTLTSVFAGPSSKELVDRAVQATASLTPLDGCANREALLNAVPPPSDPNTRKTVAEIRELVDHTTALRKTGNHKEGAALASEAVERARKVDYAPVLAEALTQLAMHQRSLGQLEPSVKTWFEAIRAAARAKNDDLMASAWTDLVFVLGAQGKLEDALKLQPAAEAVVLRGGDHPEHHAALLSNLGAVLMDQGKLKEARDLWQQALSLLIKLEKPNQIRVSVIRNNLANVLDLLGDFEGARAQYIAAIDDYTRLLGPKHPEVAIATFNFGDSFIPRGQYDEAWNRIEEARRIWEEVYGPEHSYVAAVLVTRGTILQLRGEYLRAQADFERSVAIRMKVLGADHVETATALNGLGLNEVSLRRFADARKHLDRALEIRLKKLTPDASQLADSYSALGDLARNQGRYAEARGYADKARLIYEKAFGKDHPDLAMRWSDLARCDMRLGNAARAAEEAERGHSMMQRAVGSPTQLAVAAHVLARALWEAGREKQRAVAMAVEARDALRQLRAAPDELRELEEWLRGKVR